MSLVYVASTHKIRKEVNIESSRSYLRFLHVWNILSATVYISNPGFSVESDAEPIKYKELIDRDQT